MCRTGDRVSEEENWMCVLHVDHRLPSVTASHHAIIRTSIRRDSPPIHDPYRPETIDPNYSRLLSWTFTSEAKQVSLRAIRIVAVPSLRHVSSSPGEEKGRGGAQRQWPRRNFKDISHGHRSLLFIMHILNHHHLS